jgi:hypothetical protein
MTKILDVAEGAVGTGEDAAMSWPEDPRVLLASG